MSKPQNRPASVTIVIVDDDKLSTHNLALQLRFMGEHPRSVASDNWRALLQALKTSGDYETLLAVVVGQVRRLPVSELLQALRHYDAALPLVLTSETAASVRLAPEPGLLQLPAGPLSYEPLRAALQQAAVFNGRQPQTPASAIISATGTALFRSLSGSSAGIIELRKRIQQVAQRDVPVLVTGESGVGKEVVARNLHYHSGRGDKPFIAVNCATLVLENNGAELFGREELVQGQRRLQPGLLEQAAGGTLFFDQISELPLPLQPTLLRFLEDRQFQRVGGYQFLQSDVRVVAGTRQDLEELILQQRFREDLYYRLNLMPLYLPPLRERREDLPELIKELIARLEGRGYPTVRLNSAALQSLQQHPWPGNVRELANLIERLGIIHPEEVIGISDLPLQYRYAEGVASESPSVPPAAAAAGKVTARAALKRPPPLGGLILPLDDAQLETCLANFERQVTEMALSDAAGMLSFAAARLHVSEATLQELLQRHGLAS